MLHRDCPYSFFKGFLIIVGYATDTLLSLPAVKQFESTQCILVGLPALYLSFWQSTEYNFLSVSILLSLHCGK